MHTPTVCILTGPRSFRQCTPTRTLEADADGAMHRVQPEAHWCKLRVLKYMKIVYISRLLLVMTRCAKLTLAHPSPEISITVTPSASKYMKEES